MSVTITRKRMIALGEEAIVRAINSASHYSTLFPVLDPDEIPEVQAFRQVLRITPAVARGTTRSDGIGCPMDQTVFDPYGSGMASLLGVFLALNWDDVTREAGLGAAKIIYANPCENAPEPTEADVHSLLTEYDRDQS